tara:strand:+ start:4630 stop:4812 length:183 start_codon:yes stop_codon:yes gene_type:complete
MANISKTVKEVIREMVDNDELKIVADDYGDLVLEVLNDEEEDLDEDLGDLDEEVSDKDDD